MSLRKSSSSRNGSKSEVLPKPNARRRCTPAPSSVGLDFTRRLTGRRDICDLQYPQFNACEGTVSLAQAGTDKIKKVRLTQAVCHSMNINARHAGKPSR